MAQLKRADAAPPLFPTQRQQPIELGARRRALLSLSLSSSADDCAKRHARKREQARRLFVYICIRIAVNVHISFVAGTLIELAWLNIGARRY